MNLVEYSRMYEVEDRHWWYVGLHELILATVRRESNRLGRPLNIFDAGCGTGRLCQLLSEQGHSVSGCDFSEEGLRLCRLRGVSDTFHADLNTIEFEAESFDVITSIDVLYHQGIADDVAVMKRLHTALKPGGLIILNLVALEFLRSTHDSAVHTRERYTKKLLLKRLMEAGFSNEYIGYRVSYVFPLIVLYRFAVRLIHFRSTDTVESDVKMPQRTINSLLLSLLKLENRMMCSFAMPFGSSLFSVARRGKTPEAVP